MGRIHGRFVDFRKAYDSICYEDLLTQLPALNILNIIKDIYSKSSWKVRACSNEPGIMNYPGASVTSRSHDDLFSRGNVAPGQLHCPGQVQGHLMITKLSEFL